MADHETGPRARAASSPSSQRMPSTSRWLVGSSISSTSGSRASSRAIARRFRQPPESAATSARPSSNPARPRACGDAARALVLVERRRARRSGRPRRCLPAGRRDPAGRSPRARRCGASAARGRATRCRRGCAGGWTCRRRWAPPAPPVPFEEPERQPLEEGPGAVRLAHPLTAQKKRTGHARLLLLLLRLLLLLLHAPALGHVLTSLP